MNVFWLDEDPRLAARYHCDQHVNKMLLEAAQVLCTAARENGYEREFLYRATHADHPVTRWATESRANWLELREHAEALDAEFRDRYGHDDHHASWEVISQIDPDAIAFPTTEPTLKPQAMPERYRVPDDPIAAYRAYYAGEKADWATWAYTEEPPWLESYREDSAAKNPDGGADPAGETAPDPDAQ